MTDITELAKRLRAPLMPRHGIEREAADALEAQAKEIDKLEEANVFCRSAFLTSKDRIAELEAAIEPFRQVKAMLFRQMNAITSIYEYAPVEALRDEEEFNFKMTGAEMKRIRAALNGEKG